MSVKVLLLWPGTDGAAAGNFGCPQLVTLASYLRQTTGALVTIVDLHAERVLGPVDLRAVFKGPHGTGYDVVGFSVYSSFDFLKLEAIATVARALLPDATFVAGGYHVSARPTDFMGERSPFDVAVVGEGEHGLRNVVEAVQSGTPPRQTILSSDPVQDLAELAPSDWRFLDRYKPHLRRFASQIELYLSRGCPFDCAFCMERAKREVSWRPLSVSRALDEVQRAHAYFDLTGLTVYFADALFGMRKKWRREFLKELAKLSLPARKFWLLVRVDMIDDEDLELFGAANCALGFGLESGDPGHLATIRKAGRLHDYLEKMLHVSARARELGVAWGANVIVGHPGETEATMLTSARYLEQLFLDPRGVTGFLSVDPFRLYPGSPIDDERGDWERRFGTRFHRPEWWKDGDQEFLAEWVDPSAELSYRRRAALTEQLYAPILKGIRDNFVYQGPARDYFMLAIDEQVEQFQRKTQLHYTSRYYAWNRYTGKRRQASAELLTDEFAERLYREEREQTFANVLEQQLTAGERQAPLVLALERAVSLIRRELFVPLDCLQESAKDEAIALDATGMATVSALHAYLKTYMLADIKPGMRVLDLGGGTGYGASLLCELVGETGKVVSLELDPALVELGRQIAHPRAVLIAADAQELDSLLAAASSLGEGPFSTGSSHRFDAIVCGFAAKKLDPVLGQVLRPGAVIVTPVASEWGQHLTRATWNGSSFESVEQLDGVYYVKARSREELPRAVAKTTQGSPAKSEARRLPIID